MPRTAMLTLVVLLVLALAPGGSVVAMADAPGAALDDLLSRVPVSHRDDCRADLPEHLEEALMSVSCDLPSGITVIYSQLPSADAVATRYDDRRTLEAIEWDSGDCASQLPGEQAYTIAGEPAGRLLCWDSDGYVSLAWTDDAGDIYARALYNGDRETLWSWWLNESGPTKPQADAAGPALGAALDALLASVPEGHRDTCRPFDGGGPEDGVLISLKCDPLDDLTVYYDQHTSLDALLEAYQEEVDEAGIEPDTGDCSASAPGEQGYTIGGEPAGRLLCTEFFESAWFQWTHEPTAISGTISSDLGQTETWDWWLSDSGP